MVDYQPEGAGLLIKYLQFPHMNELLFFIELESGIIV